MMRREYSPHHEAFVPSGLLDDAIKNLKVMPWLEWLSGLSAGLQTKGLLVQFPVRAHAWVAGQVPSRGRVSGNHTSMVPSLPPFPSLEINKIFKKIISKRLKSEMYNFTIGENHPEICFRHIKPRGETSHKFAVHKALLCTGPSSQELQEMNQRKLSWASTG